MGRSGLRPTKLRGARSFGELAGGRSLIASSRRKAVECSQVERRWRVLRRQQVKLSCRVCSGSHAPVRAAGMCTVKGCERAKGRGRRRRGERVTPAAKCTEEECWGEGATAAQQEGRRQVKKGEMLETLDALQVRGSTRCSGQTRRMVVADQDGPGCWS